MYLGIIVNPFLLVDSSLILHLSMEKLMFSEETSCFVELDVTPLDPFDPGPVPSTTYFSAAGDG